MYTSFFGLNEKPFSITPNPRYLYMSERHTEALAHLIYGIKDSGGFVQLTGEVGTGKTTLVRGLLQRLPGNADVALVLNPQLSATEFLAAILTELDIPLPDDTGSLKALTDALNRFLLENYSKGRRTILLVDEAQNFAVDVLEQIRLLTNLETARHKLLQITLIGQPELRTMLARTDLRQLAQRVTARYHLEPLTQEDTEEYVQHRLKVAGATRPIFSKPACKELYRLSGGIPRVINVIADRALLGAFTAEEALVEPAMVRRAAAEVYGDDPQFDSGWRRAGKFAAVAGIGALFIAAAIYTAMQLTGGNRTTPVATTAAPAPATDIISNAAAEAPTTPVAPQSAAPDPAVATADLAGLLAANADRTGTPEAFASLFRLWDVTYTPGPQTACEQARRYELACFYRQGSLAQVERLDRPAILTLQDDNGVSHQVVLLGMNEATALIDIGGITHRIGMTDLNRYWYGEYLLMWRPPIDESKALYPGMTDPDVAWLRASLSAILGRPIDPAGSDYFNDELEAGVRDYQIERRLDVDGKVGQQTLIVMNSDLATGAPQLARLD